MGSWNSKYRNKKISVNGEQFDSQREYRRYCELKLLEQAGVISCLQRQVKFQLIPPQEGERACSYKADFVYIDKNKQQVVEDVKGMRTKDYIIKRKLMQQVHGIRIREV